MNPTVLTGNRLRQSLENAPVIEKGAYDYIIHPLTDGVPRVDPALLQEATAAMAAQIEQAVGASAPIDLIVTAEAMGLPLAAMLAARMGVPFVIARKRSYGLRGEIPLEQRTGYGGATLHLNGVERGDRVIIVDDLISTGGTLRALTQGIDECGAHLLHIAAVVTKQEDLAPLAEELDCSVSAIAAITILRNGATKRVQVTATSVQAPRPV